MKTRIKTTCNSIYSGEYTKGEKGYIDGYIRGADNIPYAVVVIKDRLHQAPLHHLEPVGFLIEDDIK